MSGPERTDDGHYFVIAGRRWRATDPAIPEERRAELTRILMAWRPLATPTPLESWDR